MGHWKWQRGNAEKWLYVLDPSILLESDRKHKHTLKKHLIINFIKYLKSNVVVLLFFI